MFDERLSLILDAAAGLPVEHLYGLVGRFSTLTALQMLRQLEAIQERGVRRFQARLKRE
jgi:hypothetical protein